MSDKKSNIQIPVDLTNPGQFFACCGLLELADRLWPGAEGWFELGGILNICTVGSFNELIRAILCANLHSSLSAAELKRLGTLLSAAKASLTSEDIAEKARLQQMWKVESISVGPPFNLVLDWWRDERGNRLDPKTWAAKQLLMDIINDLCEGARRFRIKSEADLWQWSYDVEGRFNFDSRLGAMGSAGDVGFSFDALGDNRRTRINVPCRPMIELLAFFGLQRCRPLPLPQRSTFTYVCWFVPIPTNLLGAATCGRLPVPSKAFRFRLTDRNDYFKCFSPATPFQGDHDEQA
jgi:CRISPR-associated protein Csb3